jgi:hypothetical protein
MSYTRQRQNTSYYSGYRIKRNTGAVTYSSYESANEFCEDYVAKGDNYNLTVEKVNQSGGLIYGTQSSVLTGYAWWLYPCDYFKTDPWRYTHLTVPGVPADGVLALDAIARTNPSRSSMEAMEHISELLEVPSLLKSNLNDGLKRLPKRYQFLAKAAKLNIMSQFAISPIISDIETLWKFQGLVDDRVGEIERLRGPKGLRRTIDSVWGSQTSYTDYNRIVQSNGVTLRCDITKVTEMNISAHVRWHAYSNWLKSDQLVRDKVKRVISAYRLDPATLYELMPWSWFIDYFTNLGTLVKAVRNDFDAFHEPVRLIKTLKTTVTTSNHTTSGSGAGLIQFTPFQCVHISKTRQPTIPSLGSSISFLNRNQLSILGSLAVLKGL